jgi:hypothetical protein
MCEPQIRGRAVTKRSLQSFFDAVRTNQRVNGKNFPDWTSIIERIDSCFVAAGKSSKDPKPLMSGLLLNRSQYAFKAASGMALAGQIAEVFPMLRSVLEYAGYCLLLRETPDLESVFIGRHFSAELKQKQRRVFTIEKVKAAVRRRDTKLADIFDENYERSIDFGAHPNPNAVFSSTIPLYEGDGKLSLMTMALYNEPKILVHAFKCTGQVGLTALHVFQYAFGAEFEQSGIARKMEEIANTGML